MKPMKNIFLIIIVLFTSCKSTKNRTFTVTDNLFIKTVNSPNNGKCSIELIPNKSLEFKKDEFENLYPIISEGSNTIFKYTYSRKPITKTQDSNYTEIVYAELDKNISEMLVTSKELQTIKLYFGRLCYCKGETGYYPITNGEFKIEKFHKDSIKINVDFKINEVPQIISKINETISLKSN